MSPEQSASPPTCFQSNLRAELGDVALVRGRIARVRAINEGNRAITFEFVGQEPCPQCGHDGSVTINEGCLIWDNEVKPVNTCGGRSF